MFMAARNFFLILGLLGLHHTAHSAESEEGARNHQQVSQVVDAFAATWNAHDMDAFGKLFTADATWVNVRGNRWVGSEEIKSSHVAVHGRFYSESRLEFNDVSIRFLTPTTAVVHARETITGSTVPAAAGLSPDSQLSLVVVQTGGGWLIANGHNTNVATVPPPRS